MSPKRRKKLKTELEKMSTKTLVRDIRRDLHAMVLEAEGAIAPTPSKRKR